jgi:hypothetical protein
MELRSLLLHGQVIAFKIKNVVCNKVVRHSKATSDLIFQQGGHRLSARITFFVVKIMFITTSIECVSFQ